MAAARESVRISRCLTEDGIDLFGTRLRELAISLDLAGEIALLSSSLDEAKDCFGESIELRRRMIQKWGSRLAKEREMLLPMVGLVRVAREQRDWVAAQRIGRECLEIARRWVDASKRSPESLNDLAMALIVNLDLPDAPGDTLREEARHVVAELRERFPNWQQNVELEAALQSSDNRS